MQDASPSSADAPGDVFVGNEALDLLERIDAYYRLSLDGDDLDERQFPRTSYDVPVIVSPSDPCGAPIGRPICCQGKDLSARGMAFFAPQPLPMLSFARAVFVIDAAGRRRSVDVVAQVRHCRRASGERWVVGVQFQQFFLDTEV